jgi:hypothetical protein
MPAKKYVFSAARKAAFKKAQQKAWALRRGKSAAKRAVRNKQALEDIVRKGALGGGVKPSKQSQKMVDDAIKAISKKQKKDLATRKLKRKLSGQRKESVLNIRKEKALSKGIRKLKRSR